MSITKNNSFKKFFFIHLPVYIYVVGIFILSSMPDLSGPDLGFSTQDKLYHFIFYMTFGYFVARSFSNQKLWPYIKKHYLIYAILFTALYGASDEIHQYFVPGRVFSILDMVADGLGAVAGGLIYQHRNKIFGLFRKK